MKKLSSALLLVMLPSLALAAPVFTLQSKDFNDNDVMAKTFAGNNKANAACTGEGISPELNWSSAPAGTRSFALLVTDPVGGKGMGVTHLVAYNIDGTRTQFARGELSSDKGYTGGKNSPGTTSYYGPCPPAGSGLHHYNFVLVASDLPVGALKAGLNHDQLLAELKGHALNAASLIGRYGNN